MQERAGELSPEQVHKADHDLNTQQSTLILSQTVPRLSSGWQVFPEMHNTRVLDMYKCHHIRVCANIGKTHTFPSIPQYFKYNWCVFSATKNCSHDLTSVGLEQEYLPHTRLYVYTFCSQWLPAMLPFSVSYIFVICCRDRRDRLETVVGTAVFCVGTVGTTWLEFQNRTLLKRSLRSLHKI